MYISSLSIRNYRNFRKAKFKFSRGVNSIIGENGSGKTNLFQAIRLLIDDSLPRSITLHESDFNRTLGNWLGHWIIISIEFDSLSSSEEIQALTVHSVGLMDGSKKGRYTLIFRPKIEIRQKLYDYSQNEGKNCKGLKELLNSFGINDYETVFLGRGNRGFEKDTDYKSYVGNFKNIEFPDPNIKYDDIYGVRLPSGVSIPLEVSCTFVKALRDVENDLRSYNRSPLISLLRGQEKTVDPSEKESITNKINELNGIITNLSEVKEINADVGSSITETVGSTYAPNIEVRSELPNEMDKLFQSLKLWVGDPDDKGYKGRLWELSLGGANLIYLSLKMLEYERVRSTDRAANFLLIEEPESHIHTHIQKTIFSNLNKNRTQVIISTHSTQISSVSKIRSVNILSRSNQESQVFSPSNGLNDNEITRLERYLDAVRSDLLFAKGVILVEGDAEQILIPAMFKKVFGITLDEIGVSLINIGSTGFKNVARIFDRKRIRKKCSIVTDLDTSILKLKESLEEDSTEEKRCRDSQTSGLERKKALDKFCKNNNYIKSFYAKYTFEVDFVKNSNEHVIKKTLDTIYATESQKNKSIKKIETDDISIKGKEVLRLANKVGKGWFAILVEECLVYNTNIPKYILEAIAFSSLHISQPTLAKMAMYRLEEVLKNAKSDNHKPAKELMEDHDLFGYSNEEFIDEFKKKLPDDVLPKFISYLICLAPSTKNKKTP